MRSEFIFGDGKLWSISRWMCSNHSSEIVLSITPSKNYSYLSSSLMCSLCALIRLVSLLVLSVGLMWSYGSIKRTEFNICLLWTNVSLGGYGIDISKLMLMSLDLNPFLLGLFHNNFPGFAFWEDLILS